jgi:hypothetical protein
MLVVLLQSQIIFILQIIISIFFYLLVFFSLLFLFLLKNIIMPLLIKYLFYFLFIHSIIGFWRIRYQVQSSLPFFNVKEFLFLFLLALPLKIFFNFPININFFLFLFFILPQRRHYFFLYKILFQSLKVLNVKWLSYLQPFLIWSRISMLLLFLLHLIQF